ncbi:MAG: DUF4382 domain-containing protein [Gemmatimonadetes bacterium]|uniref:DUF4382 domain-containing protein n=1 Tax=Candidatus Kutchimonas denitrificans TaxID=3056748 RepID=A0AAE4ZAF2_9BACT|nr:DUF4382 domain-containing protein [Gemmatimonadota bacterium]NIR75627.1 DUF4382 domain-containing protein [Candidatus Kutchimonas denitrificans]NIS02928.1 DUF4382 domain-containing protein [Gemmatimonadota bacterium]NIT68650.1 DUF4382 domain-containing protein [Gemmatimonadota bacterium]NIV25329.1 DUF4382 domain-containing protein [Gemmatimonadota bacterium]
MRSNLRRRASGLAAVGLALALIAGACETTTNPTAADDDAAIFVNQTGSRLTLLLTDDPAELSQAWVQITGIYLQGGEGDGNDNGMESGPGLATAAGLPAMHREEHRERHQEGAQNQHENGDNPTRVWLLEGSMEWVNLLTLAEDWTTLVDAAEIPADIYSQLRFIVGGAAIVTAEGGLVFASSAADLESLNEQLTGDGMDPLGAADGKLMCPSCSQTGFKVRFPGGGLVLESGDNIVLIDFDVEDTFGHQAGRSGKWVMHPTLRATDFPGGGSIAGTVSLGGGLTELSACGAADERPITFEDFVPTAERSGGPLREADVDENGDYSIDMLPAGLYAMDYLAEVDVDVGGTPWTISFTATHPAEVNVVNGMTATADYEITAVSCAEDGS